MNTTIIDGMHFDVDPYKEPLVQLKGAVVGYFRGTLPAAVTDGRIPCAFCEPVQTFHSIGKHLKTKHQMTGSQYRDAIGLLRSTSLTSRSFRLGRSETMRKMNGRHRITPGMVAKSQEVRRERPHYFGDNPEYQNKLGHCRDQIMAQSKAIAKANGGVLRMRDLRLHRIRLPELRRVGFSNFTELAAVIGVRTDTTSPRRYSTSEIIETMRNVARELGRTPRERELPFAEGMLARRFGGYREACLKAGLPNSPFAKREGDHIDLLNAYSIIGTIDGTCRVVHCNQRKLYEVMAIYGIVPGRTEPERRAAQRQAVVIARRLAGVEDAA